MLGHFVGTTALAQATDDNSSSIMMWSVILLVVVLAMFAAVVWVRKRFSPDEDFKGEGFSLSDLRRLNKEGKLSDEEFERAKSKIVATMHAAQARTEAAKSEAAKRGNM
jgi:multidrug resistance efflux pump